MLTVNLFAGMAESVGTRRLELEWKGGTVADLRATMASRWPVLAGLLAQSAVAVGGGYASEETAVPSGADVAIIPPVSGG